MTISNLSTDRVIDEVISTYLSGDHLFQLAIMNGDDINATFIEQEFENFSSKVNQFALEKIREKVPSFDEEAVTAKIYAHLRNICEVTWPVQNGYPALITAFSSLVSYITNR